MDDETLQFYVIELQHQCEYAAIAAEDINRAFEPRPGPGTDPRITRSFAAAQTLVSAAGLVSKLLWPILPKDGNPAREARGLALREAVGVPDDSILKTKNVRNSFEHFDERIDAYFAAGHINVVDRNYGPKSGIVIGGAEPLYWRHLDPETNTIGVMSRDLVLEEVDILELVDALLEVRRGANTWIEQHTRR